MKALSNPNHCTHDLSEAINVFLTELPDPQRSQESTIMDKFLIEEKEVLLKAQKCKGQFGMQWKVDTVKKSYFQ
jgi:hypothetical protein